MPAFTDPKVKAQSEESFDIVIIGAGVSGINTAHTVKTKAPPGTAYVILERRSQIGGTWDLFRYPGIRSDSDMFTFGFSWNPWTKEKPLATGPEIVSYLLDSASKVGADKHMRFHHSVISADWSSDNSRWTVTARDGNNELVSFRTRFVVLGTGYYDFNEPMFAPIPGLDRFQGDIIKPQFWPSDYNYLNKNIVIIGSGATAVTLLPSLAADAKHVTMIQRSPTYIAALPMSRGFFTRLLQAFLPSFVTNRLNRLQHILMGYILYSYSRKNPRKVRDTLEKASAAQLPSDVPVKPHFTPRYNPWDQRLCVCPDGDFYTALRSTKASIVTDTIDEVTETEIVLKSGQRLHPDVIVPATGLKLQFAGGIPISVDGKIVDPTTKFTWQGCMLQDVPNMAFIIGYVNASWTLGAEATGVLLGRLWGRMKSSGANVAIPRLEAPENMQQVSLFALSSTYFQGASKVFPKGGVGQWSQKKNYFVDVWKATWSDLSAGIEFR
ncbi:hypothetical protein NM208_g2298 [Fusarium decemcellulare]|uniref:Uncharacterized protein n=2 Tax=Fusarium decemcellulare TaxID=57161 RepID=A0ACC1SNT9_9HYPO|nr:hypothetical protein NM208_g3501 [Fusarium decemcellulare]KAJ3545857.1 hypothetical protein NM208_g2298 [Fusarium decemcellulare]